MTKVTLRQGESQQQLFRRFKKQVIGSKIMSEVRKRRWFVSKTETRRIEKKKAIRRQRRKAVNRGSSFKKR